MIEEINILGTDYEIVRKDYKDDPYFEKDGIDGYCDGYLKKIVVGNLRTFPHYENEIEGMIKQIEKQILRHEIVHAFLDESGLNDSAATYYNAWPKNEEMVDWVAWQGPKIYEAWRQAEAL